MPGILLFGGMVSHPLHGRVFLEIVDDRIFLPGLFFPGIFPGIIGILETGAFVYGGAKGWYASAACLLPAGKSAWAAWGEMVRPAVCR